VTRESAHVLRTALASIAGNDKDELSIDYSGIEAVTPSFVDEALRILREHLSVSSGGQFRILFVNLPTRLSSKFAAIARAHEIEISEIEAGVWLINSRASNESTG